MAHSLTHPAFPASGSVFAARWTPRADSRGMLNLKSCEMQHSAASRLLDELLAGLSARDIYRYPYQEELVSRLAEANGVDPECILLTAGSYTAIGIVVDALASPAGRLLLHEPAFDAWTYYSTLRGVPAIGCAGLTSSVPPGLTTLPLLEAMAAAPPSVVALTNPGNPTGMVMPVDEVAELARAAAKSGHLLVVDECYAAFCGISHVPLVSAYPNVIVLRSLSKSWALAGARLAMVFGTAGVVDYLRRFKADAAISAPTVALATALSARTAALREIWADIATIRDRFASQVLADHPTWAAFPSATNFVTFCTGRPGGGDQIETALGRQGIRVRSLDGLPQLTGCVRISIAAQEQMDIVAGRLSMLTEQEGLRLSMTPYQAAGFDLEKAAVVSGTPFLHCTLGEATILSRAAVRELLESWPDGTFLASTQRIAGGDKTFRTNTATMLTGSRWRFPLEQLSSCWRDFLGYLAGPRYRQDIARVLEVPDGPVELEIRLTEYPRGGWMSRHTDRPEKLFSHNIYLCPDWQASWGGGLALYDDAAASEPYTVYVPGAGTSLAFARSERSWHEVLPISDSAPWPRRAVLVHGYRYSPERWRRRDGC